MRSENNSAGRGFQLAPEGFPAGISEFAEPRPKSRKNLLWIAVFMLDTEGLSTLERLAEMELIDKALGHIQICLTAFQAAKQGARHREDRVGLRVGPNAFGIGAKLVSGLFQGLAGFGSSHVRSFHLVTIRVLALSHRPVKAPAPRDGLRFFYEGTPSRSAAILANTQSRVLRQSL